MFNENASMVEFENFQQTSDHCSHREATVDGGNEAGGTEHTFIQRKHEKLLARSLNYPTQLP